MRYTHDHTYAHVLHCGRLTSVSQCRHCLVLRRDPPPPNTIVGVGMLLLGTKDMEAERRWHV